MTMKLADAVDLVGGEAGVVERVGTASRARSSTRGPTRARTRCTRPRRSPRCGRPRSPRVLVGHEAQLGPLGVVDERRHHRAARRARLGPLEPAERTRTLVELDRGDRVRHLGLEVGRQARAARRPTSTPDPVPTPPATRRRRRRTTGTRASAGSARGRTRCSAGAAAGDDGAQPGRARSRRRPWGWAGDGRGSRAAELAAGASRRRRPAPRARRPTSGSSTSCARARSAGRRRRCRCRPRATSSRPWRWPPPAGSSSRDLRRAARARRRAARRRATHAAGRAPLDRLAASRKRPVKSSSAAVARPIARGSSVSTPAAAHLAEVEVAVADPRRRGDDGEVAVEDELEPAGGGDAVDQRDRRDRQRAQPAEDPVELGDEARERDRVALQRQVAFLRSPPAQNARPGAGDEHAAHRGSSASTSSRARSRASSTRPVDGVELVGPVEHAAMTATRSVPSSASPPGRAAGRRLGLAHASLLDATRTISCFWILPDAVVGSSVEHLQPLRAACTVARPASRSRSTIVVERRAWRPAAARRTRTPLAEPFVGRARPPRHGRPRGRRRCSSSISRGAMFMPPRMMISFLRPTTVR